MSHRNFELNERPVWKGGNNALVANTVSASSSSNKKYYNPHRKTIYRALEHNLPVDICVGGKWFTNSTILDFDESEQWLEIKVVCIGDSNKEGGKTYTFSVGTLSLRSVTAVFIVDITSEFDTSKEIKTRDHDSTR